MHRREVAVCRAAIVRIWATSSDVDSAIMNVKGTLDSSPFTSNHQDLSCDYLDAVVLIAAAACFISAATGAGRDT